MTQAKSVVAAPSGNTLRDAGRSNNPRTIRDFRYRDVLVTHSSSTR
jgi:hypothetical protein